MDAKMGLTLTLSKPRFQHLLSKSKIIEVYWGSGGKTSSNELVVRVHVRAYTHTHAHMQTAVWCRSSSCNNNMCM